MNQSAKIVIDDINWERVQLYVRGHIENGQFNKSKFYFRNLTETKLLEANETIIDGNNFTCRFNIAILDDGNYLPEDEYLLVVKQQYDLIAELNPEFVNKEKDHISKEYVEEYEQLKNDNDKKNFLLNLTAKEYHQNGKPKGRVYEIKPHISQEVNEFVFKVSMDKQKHVAKGFTKFIKDIRLKYNRLSFNARNLSFKSIFYFSRYFHLRKGKNVLFTSDSRSELSGNFKFIYEEMLNQGLDEKYKINMLFKSHINERRNFYDKFKFPYLLGKADYIFVDDYHPLIYTVKYKEMQQLIQVWHAVGAFKTVGFSRIGKIGGPFFDSVSHRNYTKAIVSSEHDIPFYGEAFGIKESSILPTGIPRTDVLFDEQYKNQVTKNLKSKFGIEGKKVILFAPTFRGNGHNTAHYPFFKIDLERLAEYCKANNAVFLFKMHPFVKNKLNIPSQFENYLIDISSEREVNDILIITDLLISDYSSLIYEYSVFKKPMLFYAFDLEDYIATRDFYEPYQDFVPGKIVRTFGELINALENEDFEQEKVEPFLNKHFKYTDGNSSKRVIREIFK